jgi:hypothetical protein
LSIQWAISVILGFLSSPRCMFYAGARIAIAGIEDRLCISA